MKLRSCAALLGLWVGVFVLAAVPSAPADANGKSIVIGTGSASGVYYVLGNAICHVMRRAQMLKHLDCEAPPSGGSVDNLAALEKDQIEVAIAQADWQRRYFKNFPEMRSLFSAYPETFHIVVAGDSKIRTWADLEGKRVNVGGAKSVHRATFKAILAATGKSFNFFGKATSFAPLVQPVKLCEGEIDAFGYMAGAPNSAVAKAIKACGARLIGLRPELIAKVQSANPSLQREVIAKGAYGPGTDRVVTLGVLATIVARADVDSKVIYRLVRSVFRDFSYFRRLHPTFGHLDPKAMIKRGLTAPLHPGALRYYRERGWL